MGERDIPVLKELIISAPSLSGLLEKVDNTGAQRSQSSASNAELGSKSGSQFEFEKGRISKLTYPDGSQRSFEWDGAELKSMLQPDGKTAEHLKQEGKYLDQWRMSDGTVWDGKIQVDAGTGKVKIVSTKWPESGISVSVNNDGSKEEMLQNGARRLKYTNGDQLESDAGGHPTALITADGVKREFSDWHLDMATGKQQPGNIKITMPGKPSSEWKLKGEKWQSSESDAGLYSFEVNPTNGSYSFRNNDSGELKRYVPGKFKESNLELGKDIFFSRDFGNNKTSLRNSDDSYRVDLEKSRSAKIFDHGRERSVLRNEKGQVTELQDTTNNTLWKQDSNSQWTATALDPKKPFNKPENLPDKAQLIADAFGLCGFVGADGSVKKLTAEGKLSSVTPFESLALRLNNSESMQAEGKQRASESIRMIEGRNDLPLSEKTKIAEQIQRLLGSAEKSSYSQSDREVLAAQALWHIARPDRQEQGQHPTCNVTTVRSALIHESPADFARMISEIGCTDKFKTADGTLIDVPSSMVSASGPELQFPPSGGNRSWLSQVSDVAMANVFWQRRNVDTYGQNVAKGSLKYLEIASQYQGDNGERLYHYGADGKSDYELRERGQNVLARTPELYPADILEVMSQITGKSEKGRVIANKTQYPDPGAGVAVVQSQAEFDKEMQHGPWPKIIAVHTSRDPFWQDSGYGSAGGAGGRSGGWHVVVATGFDAKNGRVAVDNSWQPERDHNSPSRQIASKTLYESTVGPQS